jgi:hypothetical protein
MGPEATWITDAVVDAIAEDADVDQRSVLRRLAGLPVRGRSGRRIDRAVARAMATRLAGLAGVDVAIVEAAYRGDSVSERDLCALAEAAHSIGLMTPPPRAT